MQRSLTVLLCLFFLATPVVASAQSWPRSTKPVATAMTVAAQRFEAALDETSRTVALMKFDDPARMDWHNIPKPERKGLQLRDMNGRQKTLCHELLQTALSKSGYDQATIIMALEHNLREGEKHPVGSPFRDPERYYLTIFGKPDQQGTWGWSFEGHHLSLNFVIRDGEVISDTPNFWGSNPATVKVFVQGGPSIGTRNLADEEQRAFDLLQSLDEDQRRLALVSDKAPADYRFAGKPQPERVQPTGLPGSRMNPAQKKMLLSLIETYCNHLAPELAAKNLDQIQREGLEQVHFAWAGATVSGRGHYYCIHGPAFIVEFVNNQADPQGNPANHIHSVWRNLNGDFGQVIPR